MFRNLYFLVDDFADFNFNDFLDRFEEVPEDYLQTRIERNQQEGEHIEPYFEPIIPLTLSPNSCNAFFRSHPRVPASERDYYLSKLFQFLFLPAKLRFSPTFDEERAIRDRLEGFLDGLGDEILQDLSRFDWWSFYEGACELDLDTVFAELPTHLPGAVRPTESVDSSRPPPRKRGPKADIDNHLKVWAIVERYGTDWKWEENRHKLENLVAALDEANIPVPKPRSERWLRAPQSWGRALEYDPELVIKNIDYRVTAARQYLQEQAAVELLESSETSDKK
jgi:hypothetical protein